MLWLQIEFTGDDYDCDGLDYETVLICITQSSIVYLIMCAPFFREFFLFTNASTSRKIDFIDINETFGTTAEM